MYLYHTHRLLKKIYTICCLSLLLILQYSKQWSYLQCELFNVANSGHCDCETQHVVNSSGDQDKLPPSKTNLPSIPDDLYISEPGDDNGKALTEILTLAYFNTDGFFPDGYYRELLRPPGSLSNSYRLFI